ncbi:hypothetical protein ACE6H2_017887 [Prunus campanulata]
MCLFRFKLWWMIPSFEDSGCEVPAETQMLLLETREKSTVQNGLFEPTTENSLYILLLPVLDGPFRASLQGNTVNELEFCIESGDPNVQTSQVTEAVFMNLGDNPFKLIRNSTKILAKHKGTFNHVEIKKIPAHVDWFGWSIWDAFYHKVDPEGIEKGLKRRIKGGFPPKFLIIDEGWQNKVMEVEAEPDETDSPYHATSVDRLTSIEENNKFKSFRSGKSYANLREFVKFIKEEYGLNSKQGAATRVSEDFMPMEPTFQTLHVAAVAFNSLLMREGQVRIRGCGRFGAYSNKKPRSCIVDKKEEFIVYNANNGLLLLKLHGQCSVREIEIVH